MAINFDDEELFWDFMYGGEDDMEPKKSSTATTEPEPEGPSPDEKVRAALIANEAMKAEEANAEKLWNSQGRPEITPEIAAGFTNQPRQYGQVMPTSRGFMYVGAPPSSGEPGSGLDRMKSMGLIQPPSRALQPTDVNWSPAYDQWAAQQNIRAAVAKGVPIAEALAQNPAALGGLRAGAQESLARSSAPAPITAATVKRPLNVGGVGYTFDPVTGTYTRGTEVMPSKPPPQLTPQAAAKMLTDLPDDRLETKLPNGETARQYLEKIAFGGTDAAKPAAPTIIAPPSVTATNSAQAPLSIKSDRGTLSIGNPGGGETSSGTIEPPTAVEPAPLPLPSKQSELVTGQRYMTRRGVATWNGSAFVK